MNKIEISKETVKHVASLARIEIRDEEIALTQNHMQKFLDNVLELSNADTENTVPFFSPAKENESLYIQGELLREDKVEPSLTVSELLKNAPKQKSNQFRVDAVIESE